MHKLDIMQHLQRHPYTASSFGFGLYTVIPQRIAERTGYA